MGPAIRVRGDDGETHNITLERTRHARRSPWTLGVTNALLRHAHLRKEDPWHETE